jgi:pimeloyl-ACP methyl ester carboxylesterase
MSSGEQTTARALGRELRYRAVEVSTPDGVLVRAQDWGSAQAAPGGGRDVLLIHGFSQAHLCWLKQVTGPLAERYRLVTYDLRGHGSSQKPRDAAYYQDPKRWAGEVASVIWTLELENPVVVAHSYAGRVVLDYLRHIRPNPIAGLVMVDASSKADSTVLAEGAKALRGAISTELAINIEGVEKLLDVFFAGPLGRDERALMLAFNMATPAAVRKALARPADYDDVLRCLSIPVLAIHGKHDAVSLVAMSEHTVATVPNGRLIVYESSGHLPFWEEAERFDADVAAFIDGID